ncbi:hypothetical protein BC833DRAFT_611657 [Globomyces pollinis-pini]|nr:hypothetical protein BC833DRAFT_611657 [Globomyces pollinis-pini]
MYITTSTVTTISDTQLPLPTTSISYSTTFTDSFLHPDITSISQPFDYPTSVRCGGKDRILCPYENSCCSSDGFCGYNNTFCGIGCQIQFGNCWAKTTTTHPLPTKTNRLNPTYLPLIQYPGANNLTCGGPAKTPCDLPNSCCSMTGICGFNDFYCGEGCQAEYGKCGTITNQLDIAVDGQCGPKVGQKCPNNECCSVLGECGLSSFHCKQYCMPGFGICTK